MRTRLSTLRRMTKASVLFLLLVLLSSCGFPGQVSTAQQLPQVTRTAETRNLPPVRFPQDEGAHNNLTEWWYYTGHFDAREPGGKLHNYGFELVVFQAARSDLPPLYASHFAISDITRGEFHYDQRSVLLPTKPAPPKEPGINVNVGDWRIQGVNGHDTLQASMKDYAFTAQLQDKKKPILHNGNGLITYGLAGFSYYYSRTRMELSGTLTDHGRTLQINGQAWMDHQWGDFLTLAKSGWDWYSIQLEDNTEMMLYFIRDATGKVISTYIGSIDQSGNDYVIKPAALRSEVLGQWTSPTTHITYPSGWRLTINDPRIKGTLTVTPQLKDQELVVYQSTGNVYWEGAVTVQFQSKGKTTAGKGYVELTGYQA